MSLSSQRGKDFERKVRKMTSKILQLDVQRDSRSGAGDTHKADVRDRFAEIPLFIECKDQEKANIKADWRKANGQASYGQAPVVVFPDNEEVLVTMRYSDLLQILRESMDWKASFDELKGKVYIGVDMAEPGGDRSVLIKPGGETPQPKKTPAAIKGTSKIRTCRNGHICDEYGYCMAKKCEYSRGYKKPKDKKK